MAGRIYSSAGILAVQHIARLEREDPHKLAALVTIMRAQFESSGDGERP